MKPQKNQLGAYITHEYGILVKIFSYLPSKSLMNASKVCREWECVAQRIILKRNRPMGFCKYRKMKWSDELDLYLQPKVILHFSSSRGSKNLDKGFYPMMSQKYNMDFAKVHSIKNSHFIASDYNGNELRLNHKLGADMQAFLSLSDMPGFTVNSFCISTDLSPQEIDQTINDATKFPVKPKSLLLITDCDGLVLADLVLSAFKELSPINVAGGACDTAIKSRPFKRGVKITGSCLCVTFHGENVSTNVGLHHMDSPLDRFLIKLSKEVGRLPSGAYRIAFLFSCINRLDTMGHQEVSQFKEYFPNVPLYGVWSFGEFMTVLHEDFKMWDPTIGLRKWLHGECSSYLILTIRGEGV